MSRTKKFKMTDLGPIPEDWEVERIAENALPLRNNTLAREAMCETSSGVGNVHYGDVLIKYDSVLDCTESCVPDLIDGELYCKDCLQDGDVVFADTAEDETVGKAVEITNILDRKIVAGLHTIAFRPREKFERGWLGYFVNSKTYHDQLLPLIVGTKVCSVSRSGVGQTFWARPTASEQRHIAAALSDADELIAALTELLEKKDWKNYRIEVHALKSASANIGADRLSTEAKEHEDAAAAENEEFITQNSDGLLEDYRNLLSEIRVVLKKKMNGEPDEPEVQRREIGTEDLENKLKEALHLLETFKSKECAEIVNDLCTCKVPEGIEELLEQVQTKLKLYADDEAEDLLREAVTAMDKMGGD